MAYLAIFAVVHRTAAATEFAFLVVETTLAVVVTMCSAISTTMPPVAPVVVLYIGSVLQSTSSRDHRCVSSGRYASCASCARREICDRNTDR